MAWHAALWLRYRRDGQATRAFADHEGPLRVLKALYPEGEGVCHHTVLHPPSGIVGGDVLDLDVRLDAGCHAVITTPGASRFYRCDDAPATQNVLAQVAPDARLEWLPQENIAYSGTRMINRQRFVLAAGSEMFGCDVLALGLPASGAGFDAGSIYQCLDVNGHWLDEARIDAADALLLNSALGLAGRKAIATLWWACGSEMATARSALALELARAAIAAVDPRRLAGGVSQVHPQVLVLRALADHTEVLNYLVRTVRGLWREQLWALPTVQPRVWAT
jgi:urease accessory protein